MQELITSAANPTVKRFRALADRKHRRRENAFRVEGLQPVWRAVTAGWTIDALLVSPELLRHPAAREMVADQERRGVRVARLGRDLFGRISGRDGPAGLAAIVRGAVEDLGAFRPRPGGPVVALHRAGNPGNVGTILRAADAADAGGVLMIGPGADPLDPAAVKSSMGSVFAVPLARSAGPDEFFAWAERRGMPVIAVTGGGDVGLWDPVLDDDVREACAVLFGSEGDGLPDEMVGRCTRSVSIPMRGTAESLNLATAVSITLYEIARRRWA